MFSFLKRNKTPVLAPITKSGFFSTDGRLLLLPKHSKAEMIKKTFQRTAEDFKPIMQSGEAYAMDSAEAVAMDAAIQGTKMSPTALGGNVPDTTLLWYLGLGFIGYQTAALLSQQWLIDKANTMPARDAARRGYEIAVNDGTEVDPEVLDEIAKLDKKFKIRAHCVDHVRKGRMFGIRIAMFDIESKDPKYYEKPFNPDGITPGSYKGITQIDPYWITPELDADAAANPVSQHFYEPTWWRVIGKRIHRSHLIIMRNGDVADILKPSYFYGGIPVPQKIMERVYAAERTADEAPMLAMTKRLTVLSVDVAKALADMPAFQQKMTDWTVLMNNFGVKIIGEGENINQFDTSLADLDAAIMTQYQLVCAGADCPSTKLLGTQPKGFNSTGDYETDSYHEFLESLQEDYMTPLVDRHHLIQMRSHIAPKFKIKPFDVEITWRSIDAPKAEELADTNLKKSTSDMNYVQMGAVSPEQVQKKLINDKYSGFNGMEMEEVPDITTLPDEDEDEVKSAGK